MDVITQLSNEHAALRGHLEQIELAAESRSAADLSRHLEAAHAALTDELNDHIAVEEAEVFSAAAGTLGDDLVAAFYDEHAAIQALRDEIYRRIAQGQPPFEQSLQLCELILSHQQREDVMLFPSVRTAM
jgi:hemerythrin-like domain-containing protein